MRDLLNTFPDGCSLHLGDLHECMYICMYVCMYVCMYIWLGNEASMQMLEDHLPKVYCKHGRHYMDTTHNWTARRVIFTSLVTTISISSENKTLVDGS